MSVEIWKNACAESRAAELTKLKADVERLRTSVQIAEGIIDRIAPSITELTPESRTLIGDAVSWKRCHSESAFLKTVAPK